MTAIPDVLGYKLEDAAAILEASSLEFTIRKSISGKYDKEKVARVIQLRNLSDNTIELIISYF